MSERKKILFLGLGSIGTRHLRLLKKNYNYEIYAYRTKKGNSIPDIKNLYNLKEAFQIKPNIAFITNPTHLHVETAISCLKAGIKNIFIEKPLSNNLINLDYLIKESEKSKALIYIGYQMRHNPILIRLKNLVEERINQIFYTETKCSSFLPNWRPDRDYRSVYSAKKSEGGGVILDVSHEFDYNEWLFGKFSSINGSYGKISKLEIDAEDFCDVMVTFKNNIIGKIHLDLFSYCEKRILKILTPNEEIVADLINKIILIKNSHTLKKENFQFEADYVYEQQLKYFLNNVENNRRNISNLKDAKDLLEKLLEFKKNNKMIENKYSLKNY